MTPSALYPHSGSSVMDTPMLTCAISCTVHSTWYAVVDARYSRSPSVSTDVAGLVTQDLVLTVDATTEIALADLSVATEREVAGSGIRISKTDVGWIGNGYQYAFQSVKNLSGSIEDNSDGKTAVSAGPQVW